MFQLPRATWRFTWSALYRAFGKGLLAILPIAVTLYALYWLASIAEQSLSWVILLAIPDRWYIPGMGFVLGLFIVLAVGLALQVWVTRRIYDSVEALISRIPLIKSIYGSVRDLLSFFTRSTRESAEQVVVVNFAQGQQRMQLIGFVTRDDLHDLPEGFDKDHIAVYFPMSYQVGGYTLFIDRQLVTPVEMSTEEALRFAVTAGMSTDQNVERAFEESAEDTGGAEKSGKSPSRSNRAA
jgi:uncharacterized membrane protein